MRIERETDTAGTAVTALFSPPLLARQKMELRTVTSLTPPPGSIMICGGPGDALFVFTVLLMKLTPLTLLLAAACILPAM